MPHTHYVPLTWERPGRWWPQRVDEGSSPGSAGTTGHPDPPQEGLKALPSSRASTTSGLSGPDPSCGFGKDLNRNGRNPRTSQTSSFKVPVFISARMKMGQWGTRATFPSYTFEIKGSVLETLSSFKNNTNLVLPHLRHEEEFKKTLY